MPPGKFLKVLEIPWCGRGTSRTRIMLCFKFYS